MAAKIPPKVSKWVDVGVSFGAALVIWGALRKITHAADADIWLWIGLTTEAVIFALYGVLYIVFPAEDAPGHDEELLSVSGVAKAAGGPQTMQALQQSFEQLNATVAGLKDVTDMAAASQDFTKKTREVTTQLDAVKSAYSDAAASVGAFAQATSGAQQFHEQIQVLTKNLSSLNTIYELELQDSNNHLKALNSFYFKLTEVSNTMMGSVEDAKRVQEQVGQLAGNLGRLNSIYGNMLTAMQGRS
ncbi:MAG: gliding motility protein GldL [Bacteroidetes bacterium]|nr:gliding motility protein GldL [Bacteroidota bacterium]